MKKIILSLICMCTLMLTACIHTLKTDVQQGNIVTQSMLDQLKPGMSENDVIEKLGAPVLVNTFSDSRFDYIYTNKIGQGDTVEQRITCYFDKHKLLKVVGNLHPGIETPA